MPSVIPQSGKLRSLRRALGLTQIELALVAGVSERTIRNAERGRPIDHAFLSFIAGALGVTLSEVAMQSTELADHSRWMKNCEKLLFGLQHSMEKHDPRPLTEYLHPEFELHQVGTIPGVDLLQLVTGDYFGPDEFQRFVERTQQFWAHDLNGSVVIEAPKGDADTVMIRGFHELRREDGGVAWGRFQFVADFEDEKIRAVVATIVPCLRPAQLQGILSADVGTNSLGACRKKLPLS
jgi:transcriptional regulator with XRE-family HTH domain